jgi:hypothetical protein
MRRAELEHLIRAAAAIVARIETLPIPQERRHVLARWVAARA